VDPAVPQSGFSRASRRISALMFRRWLAGRSRRARAWRPSGGGRYRDAKDPAEAIDGWAGEQISQEPSRVGPLRGPALRDVTERAAARFCG
jgi:hypothetical protein